MQRSTVSTLVQYLCTDVQLDIFKFVVFPACSTCTLLEYGVVWLFTRFRARARAARSFVRVECSRCGCLGVLRRPVRAPQAAKRERMACCGSRPPPEPVPAPAPRPTAAEAEPPQDASGAADASRQQPGSKAAVVHTMEELPLSLQHWANGESKYIRVSKSTYPANAPNEDRCTVAADTQKGFIFAGVWDGHGVRPYCIHIAEMAAELPGPPLCEH